MDNLNKFKKIADEEMKDLRVTPELMKKTLKRCEASKRPLAGKLLLTAACLAILVGTVQLYQVYQKINRPTPNDTIPKITTFQAEDEKAELLPDLKEAKKRFGSAFLAPEAVPEGFILREINYTEKDNKPDRINLLYQRDTGSSFLITEQKTGETAELRKSEEISIGGTVWYRILTGDAQNAELTRYTNGVRYTISGFLSEDETILIAEFLK